MLRFLDAGESHGKAIVVILEGIPFGIPVDAEGINNELSRRRLGYGRSARMNIEADEVKITSGIRAGITIGSPLTLEVANAEYEKWKIVMNIEKAMSEDALTQLRPGHADLAGAIKYGTGDVRNILERASARETVGRVCAGAVAKSFLNNFDIEIYSHVRSVDGVQAKVDTESLGIELLRGS